MIYKKTIRTAALFVILLFSAWPVAFNYAAEIAVPDNSFTGLPNFTRVSGMLYRGAQPTAEGFSELKKRGVKTIINLRDAHSDVKLIKGLGFRYANIQMNAWNVKNKDIVRAMKIILSPENQPVFIHCQHGSDRTGTLAAVYRIYADSWTIDEAMAEMNTFGYHRIWKNLRTYLKHLDLAKLTQQIESAKPEKVPIVE